MDCYTVTFERIEHPTAALAAKALAALLNGEAGAHAYVTEQKRNGTLVVDCFDSNDQPTVLALLQAFAAFLDGEAGALVSKTHDPDVLMTDDPNVGHKPGTCVPMCSTCERRLILGVD